MVVAVAVVAVPRPEEELCLWGVGGSGVCVCVIMWCVGVGWCGGECVGECGFVASQIAMAAQTAIHTRHNKPLPGLTQPPPAADSLLDGSSRLICAPAEASKDSTSGEDMPTVSEDRFWLKPGQNTVPRPRFRHSPGIRDSRNSHSEANNHQEQGECTLHCCRKLSGTTGRVDWTRRELGCLIICV